MLKNKITNPKSLKTSRKKNIKQKKSNKKKEYLSL